MSKYDEEHENIEHNFIPPLIKIIFTTAAGLISFFCFIIVAKYLLEQNSAFPKDIVSLMAYSVMFIVFINIPWTKLFYKIKKIGPVEFQHVFESQIKEIADLEDRLSSLENNVNNNAESYSNFIDGFYEKDLKDKLTDFLYEHRPTAFSPIRIKEWGGKQNGYEIFFKHDVTMIRRFLRKLLSEDKLTTTISKKGNILYRISDD